ncbi:hypothetical protein EPA93_46275 [Ktedonosporobacter rubrisoli]|uniref:Effector-associated domain-containing protein n=1 Tax=Ktedonosporobacter rubrisoli TaxID=2509675 RepID=A0A4P6K558_KTERU|nr:effector-associated domain EAD1-containing protein [Ktedonosporobacter rubrisoli]QBD82980.1 hypothetical protein EPA93_46275 [Ktedonosporobacter rubrisoli]
MDLERSKELRNYLQTILHLPFVFPEPEEDAEFYDKVYTELKPYHTMLCTALEHAYSDEKKLSFLVKQEWEKGLGEIYRGESYSDKLHNTIDWMEAEGCLLEFIAAAHQKKDRNPKLNTFVRKTLYPLLVASASTLQKSQSDPLPLSAKAPSDVKVNNNGSEMKKGIASTDIKSSDETSNGLPVLEKEQDTKQTQPTPFPGKKPLRKEQLKEDSIAKAHRRTRAAQEKMQKVYEVFQGRGKLSESQVIESIKQAKELIEGISDLFVDIPTPDYLELDYKFACEERYVCERISIVVAYSLRDEYIDTPSVFLGADREFKKVFSSLQNLEYFIEEFQEQIRLSDHANKDFFGNSI